MKESMRSGTRIDRLRSACGCDHRHLFAASRERVKETAAIIASSAPMPISIDILPSMPVDVAAEVIANTRLSADYNVLALAAPEIAAAAAPGQFVMVKAGARPRSAAAPPVLGVRSAARRARRADRHLAPQQAHRRHRPRLLYDGAAGRARRVPRPARPPVHARSIRRPKRGWSPAASASRRSRRSPRRCARAASTTTLFYGARSAAELFYLDFFRDLGVALVLTTEDGSRGERGRVTAPLERALARAPAGAPGHDLRVRPEADAARRRAKIGGALRRARARCRSSASWAAAWAAATAASSRCATTTARPSRALVPRRPRARRAIRSCGTELAGWSTDDDGPLRSASARSTLDESAHRGERLLRLRRRVRGRRSISSSLGGVAVKGLFLAEREGHPPPRIVETPAGMLNAIGLQGIGVHRFVDEKLPELRARGATVIVNICGTTLDEYVEVSRILSDAEGVARDRAEHLVPEHQGRRHPVRLQPDRHASTSSARCAR